MYNVIAEVYSLCVLSIAALAHESSWDLAAVTQWEFGGGEGGGDMVLNVFFSVEYVCGGGGGVFL